MAGPSVSITRPPSWLFYFPPSPEPLTLVPSSTERTYANPISVNPDFFLKTFDPRVPITFATCYMTFVFMLNRVNKKRGNKPWAISKSPLFHIFVVVHNMLLAVYSGLTCAALVRALRVSAVSPRGPSGLAATADSLCKISGPRGYGAAVAYDPAHKLWSSANSVVQLGADGLTPNPFDQGRIWNEGLGFWGWLFYLSKFYEVVDTLVILAKGKRSSTLQTYHHAGAMFAMWAGMRYMSAPIWMFVMVNSGIHALMYTYYTLSTLGIAVPRSLKRTLTTMQIMQFVVGVGYATGHLFISYTIPVSTPSPLSWFRKTQQEYQQVRCVDTSGEAFAIWLNVIYLAPLTVLFVRFFVKSYLRRSSGAKSTTKGKGAQPTRRISASAMDAARRTSDALEGLGSSVEQSMDEMGEEVREGGAKLRASDDLSHAIKELKRAANGYAVKDGGEVMEEQETGRDESVTIRLEANGSAK